MAYNGSMVELTCSVRNGEGIQPLNVSWMKHTSISSRTLSSYNLRGHLLILEEAQLDDSGTYCCWVDNVQEDCIEISIVEQGTILPYYEPGALVDSQLLVNLLV